MRATEPTAPRSAVAAALESWRTAERRLSSLARRRRHVLALLVTAQVAVTLVFASAVQHNGPVWFQGGDQIWYATTGRLLGGLELPPTSIGYGWPLVLAPVMLAAGPDYVGALPAVLSLNVFVLAPLLLVAVYGIAERIGGRTFALWAGAAWVAAPPLSIPLFVDRYHERLVEQTLPQAYGLTGMADFPSMVAVAVAALLVLRSLAPGGERDAILAGLVAGFALGVKPANALFLAGPALAYLLARRWRPGLAFGVALGPAALALAVWKQRGLGTVPLFSLGEAREAAGVALVAAESWFDRYVPLDREAFGDNMAQIREYFWSVRVAQWAPFAGALAVARRSLPAAGLLLGWVLAYVLVKGSSTVASVDSGSFFRLVMPAWPAYLVLLAAIPLLVPGLVRRLEPVAPPRALGWRPVAAAAVVLAALPLLVVSFARPIAGPERAVLQPGDSPILTPVDEGIALSADRDGEAVRLTWRTPAYRPSVYYRVYRTGGDEPDVECGGAGAAACELRMLTLVNTRTTTYLDGSPPPGVAYRIGVATNNEDDPAKGDVFAISPPLRIG